MENSSLGVAPCQVHKFRWSITYTVESEREDDTEKSLKPCRTQWVLGIRWSSEGRARDPARDAARGAVVGTGSVAHWSRAAQAAVPSARRGLSIAHQRLPRPRGTIEGAQSKEVPLRVTRHSEKLYYSRFLYGKIQRIVLCIPSRSSVTSCGSAA